MKRRSSGKQLVLVLLLLVVVVSGAMRVARCGRGLPYLYDWDEPATASIALQMMKTGDFNPHFFHYGTVLTYASLVVDVFHYLYLMGQPEGPGPYLAGLDEITTYHDTGWYWNISHPGFYYWNRFLVAMMGTLSIALAWLLAARIAGPWAGLAAAAVLGGSRLHIEQSALVLPNILVSFLVVCAGALCLRFLANGRKSYFILALAACGLAASAKYNAAICLLIPMLTLAVSTYRSGFRDNVALWAALPAIPALAFVAGTPHAFLDLPAFLRGAGYQVRHYFVRGHGVATVAPGASHLWSQAASIASDLGIVAALIALVGVARMARHAMGVVLILFCTVYIGFMGSTRVEFERNLLLVYPFIAIAAGCGVMELYLRARQAGSRFGAGGRVFAGAAAILLAAAAGSGLATSAVRETGAAGARDTRTRAMEEAISVAGAEGDATAPAVPEELRVHRLDLNRPGAKPDTGPLLDLLCDDGTPGRLFVTARHFEASDPANRTAAETLDYLVTSMLGSAAASIPGGPMYLDRPSRDPGILLARRGPAAETGALQCTPAIEGGNLAQDGRYVVWESGVVKIPPGGAVSTGRMLADTGTYVVGYTARGTRGRDDRPGVTIRVTGYFPDGHREDILVADQTASQEMTTRLLRFDDSGAATLQIRIEFPDAERYSDRTFLHLQSLRVALITPPAAPERVARR